MQSDVTLSFFCYTVKKCLCVLYTNKCAFSTLKSTKMRLMSVVPDINATFEH